MSRPLSLFQETPYGSWIMQLLERIRSRKTQPNGPLTSARSRVTQLRERVRRRETRSNGPFPWTRSHGDTRHTAPLIGLSAVVCGLVLTLLLTGTHESELSRPLGSAFTSGVAQSDEHLHRSRPARPGSDRSRTTELPASTAPIVSGDLSTPGSGPGSAIGGPPGDQGPPGPNPVPQPGPPPSPAPSPEPSPFPEPSPSPEPSPDPSPSPAVSPSPAPSPSPEPSPKPQKEEKPPKEKPPKEGKPPK